MGDSKVAQALQLLSMCVSKKISVREAVNIIEIVTKEPANVREVLKTAEERGLIKREGNRIFFKEITMPQSAPLMIKRKCESTCTRCGRKITSCYFISLSSGTIGPFGSECVRKLKLI